MFISGRVYRVKWKRRNEDTYIELVIVKKKLRFSKEFYSTLYLFIFLCFCIIKNDETFNFQLY